MEVSKELTEFRLQEEEVAGLYEADADELIELMEGRRELVHACGVTLHEGKLQASKAKVARSSFVERDLSYYVSIFKFLQALVRQ